MTQKTNATCSLKPTIDAPALETPEAEPSAEEAATHGAHDIRLVSTPPLDIKQEILRLADHGLYATFPAHITIDSRGKKRSQFPSTYKHIVTVGNWQEHIGAVLDAF